MATAWHLGLMESMEQRCNMEYQLSSKLQPMARWLRCKGWLIIREMTADNSNIHLMECTRTGTCRVCSSLGWACRMVCRTWGISQLVKCTWKAASHLQWVRCLWVEWVRCNQVIHLCTWARCQARWGRWPWECHQVHPVLWCRLQVLESQQCREECH